MSSVLGDGCLARGQLLVVDDHPAVREGLRAMIAAEAPDLEIAAEAEDVPAALEILNSRRLDAAIVDLFLKSTNGLGLISTLRDRWPHMRVLAWSARPEWMYAQRTLAAGAHGYVHKGRATCVMIDAIRTVLRGKVYLSNEACGRVLQHAVGSRAPGAPIGVDSLSDRELVVFELIGRGASSQEIAARLHIGVKTVETYRARIKAKLRLASATELVHRAVWHALETGPLPRPERDQEPESDALVEAPPSAAAK